MTLAYPLRKSYFANNTFLNKTSELLRKLPCPPPPSVSLLNLIT